MQTIKAESEARLESFLGFIHPERASWQAQTFKLSNFINHPQHQEIQQTLSQLIATHLSNQEGFIFILKDGDIVIIAKNIPATTFQNISSGLVSYLYPKYTQSLSENFSRLYALGASWEDLKHLAESKLNLLNATAIAAKTINPSSLKALFEIAAAKRHERIKPCVLIVEDDALSLYMTKMTLEGDMQVVTAKDGASAREAYARHAPDIVFLDIELPDTTGHQLLPEIKSMDPNAFVIMLSGRRFQTEILRAMKEGAKGFVGKPFSRASLLHYIHQVPTHVN